MTRIMAAVLKWGERVEASCDDQHGRLGSNLIQDVDDDGGWAEFDTDLMKNKGEASFEHAGKTDLDPSFKNIIIIVPLPPKGEGYPIHTP